MNDLVTFVLYGFHFRSQFCARYFSKSYKIKSKIAKTHHSTNVNVAKRSWSFLRMEKNSSSWIQAIETECSHTVLTFRMFDLKFALRLTARILYGCFYISYKYDHIFTSTTMKCGFFVVLLCGWVVDSKLSNFAMKRELKTVSVWMQFIEIYQKKLFLIEKKPIKT